MHSKVRPNNEVLRSLQLPGMVCGSRDIDINYEENPPVTKELIV